MKNKFILLVIFIFLFTPLHPESPALKSGDEGKIRIRSSVKAPSFRTAVTGFTAIALADTSIKAEVDKLSLTTDETLTYKLVITSPAKRIPQPRLPKFEGFLTLSNARSSQISISSGTQKTLVVYVVILVPVKIGKLKIGPSQIEIKGKNHSSDAFEIEVKPGKVKPRGIKPKTIPSLPNESQPETEQLPQITL